jgi:ankyrin repeat protein
MTAVPYQIELAILLIAAGSNVNYRTTCNLSALTIAFKVDNVELARSLLAAGAEITEKEEENITTMMR